MSHHIVDSPVSIALHLIIYTIIIMIDYAILNCKRGFAYEAYKKHTPLAFGYIDIP